MSVKQYPHFLFVHLVSESVQDNEGNWTGPVDEWVLHANCREETNGAGKLINGPDGKAVAFSSTVYLPKSSANIEFGTEIKITSINDVLANPRAKGHVLNFSQGQMNSRLWV
jgi:hypothetical protein